MPFFCNALIFPLVDVIWRPRVSQTGTPTKKNIVRTSPTSDIPEKKKKKNGSRLAKIELVNIKKRNLEGFE